MAEATRSKRDILRLVHKYVLIVVGCAILAIGDVGFISPYDLVTGGIFSVAVIIQHFVTASGSTLYVIDIVTWIIQAAMIVVSFIFLGKKYTLRSLFATLAYPALITLFSRVPMVNGMSLGAFIGNEFLKNGADWGIKMLAGLAGGACIGTGVAICYYAGGSTGGFDIISSIVAKHTPVKEATSALIIDGTLVILGMILLRDMVNGIVGILSAFTCALAIQYIYVNGNAFVIADIVSVEWEKIKVYVETKMDRSTTLINATGGYSGENKVLLRVAFSKRELPAFRSYIGVVDPRAFVTFTQASMINGEGFDPLVREMKFKKKNKSKDGDLHG